MNIQIDTGKKIIKLEQAVNLGELDELLNRFFPNGEWKEFTLQTNTTINNWNTPIVIEKYNYPPTYPWWQGPYYVGYTPGIATPGFTLEAGNPGNTVFNLSVND